MADASLFWKWRPESSSVYMEVELVASSRL